MIPEGSLLTHVCGIAAKNMTAPIGSICCAVDAAKSFEITIHHRDGPRTFQLLRR